MKIPIEVTEDGLVCMGILKLHKRHKTGLGKPVFFIIDTGSPTTILTNQHAKKFNLSMVGLDKKRPTQLAGHKMGEKSLGEAIIKLKNGSGGLETLEINPMKLLLTTSTSPLEKLKAEEIPALIGRDFLKQNKLLLHYDTCKEEAYFESCEKKEK